MIIISQVICTGVRKSMLGFPIQKLVNLLLCLFVGPLSREIWIVLLELGVVLDHTLDFVIPGIFDLDFRNGPIVKTPTLLFQVLQNSSSGVAALIGVLWTRLLLQIEYVDQGVVEVLFRIIWPDNNTDER